MDLCDVHELAEMLSDRDVQVAGRSGDRAHPQPIDYGRRPMVAVRTRTARRELELDEVALAMEIRLALGASRIGQAREPVAAASALRSDQARVFADFATYLADVATRPPAEQRAPFCRIILPPRTGKIVVAGHIVDRAELTATFIVPTRTLLEQTVRELTRLVPGVEIGSYGGGHDHVVLAPADRINQRRRVDLDDPRRRTR